LFGRADLAREHLGATTLRNMFISYKGGAYSRAGTAFVCWSAQQGRPLPPRLIPFQFSINQGLILEFGNFYMRVILNGALVTENPIPISNVTQADPGVVTAGGGSGATASPVDTNVYVTYAPGDTITLAGGSFSSPAVLLVNDTTLLSSAPLNRGTGYTPGDQITLAGGTFSTAAVVTIAATTVVSVALASAGTGGTPGNATVTGTTGTGTFFQANVTIDNTGVIASVNSILSGGTYTVNPTNLANEPVTGGGLTGATLTIEMGVDDHSTFLGGDYTANATVLTQNTTTGSGIGATFQSPLYGPLIVSFADAGVYTTFPTNPVSQASSSGGGLGAQFNITWSSSSANGFNTGDWVFIKGVEGMVELNGQTFVITVLSPTSFSLQDVFGNNVDTSVFPAYITGGTVARIFQIPTIYSDADLEYLKFVQSADVMTICCVNQVTGTEYPPQDLARFSDTNWVFSPVVPPPSIAAPTGVVLHSSPPFGFNYPQYITSLPSIPGANYLYRITAVNDKGEESVPSVVFEGQGTGIDCVDVSATAGSITISWQAVPGARYYNVYKAEPGSTALTGPGTVPSGPVPPSSSLFGFAGSSFGTAFVDSNITPDFQQVPPVRLNPFARGQIIAVTLDNGGSGYDLAPAVVINSATGSGAVIEADILITSGSLVDPAGTVPGPVAALTLVDGGMDYQQGDTITIVGAGSGATGHITIGPQSGTYPGVPNYFQQRRVFGNTLNNPDTYYMSVPGQFHNFDSRIPTIDTDAITGTPWSLQVNGIQFFVLMPAGLATFTGLSAWLLVGAGSFATNVQPISPKSQVAQPLAFTGCSSTLPPIKINYDILYVSSKNSYYYDLPYQLYALSEPIDLTIFSSHLFDQFALREHTWAESPFKLVWSVRNDGSLLSLTFLKQQQVAGWARHDTNGHFFSVASVVEPVIATVELPTDLPLT
jgi:hypothetical protein